MRIGVLSLQGAFGAHSRMLAGLGVEAVAVRQPSDLSGIEGLILPGGESTTLSMLIESSGLRPALEDLVRDGLPMFGTCAGMILLSQEVVGRRHDQLSFAAIDITVERNGYGRQLDSFEAEIGLDAHRNFRGVFIRAPRVVRVGPGVTVLATHNDDAVLLENGRVLVASFHPELTEDPSIHQLFITRHISAGIPA